MAAPGRIVPVEASGFSGAAIFRVDTEAGSYCLRRWPPGTMSGSRLAGIHRLVTEIFRSGIRVVPVPLAAENGLSFVDDRGTLWQLEPWMPGEADFHKTPTTARLESALTILARIHNVGEAASLAATHRGTPQTIPERLEILRETVRDSVRIKAGLSRESDARFRIVARKIATQFEKRQTAITAALNDVSRNPVPILPCLRDVWHDHLLFSGDTLTGLIDFGAVRLDTVSADLSRLLGSLFQSAFEPDRSRWDAALSIYELSRPLTTGERSLIPILDESGVILSGMHWLRARYVRNSPFDLPRVCERLESIAARLEAR